MKGRVSIGSPCRRVFSFLAVGVVALTASSLAAQAPAAVAAQTSMTQQPVFEVASIKENKSGDGNSHSSFNNGRFSATNETVKMFVQYDAYGIPAPQIVGGPSWFSSTRFDVEAKVDDQNIAQMEKLGHEERSAMEREIMQQLLADRFKLAVHWDTKEVPVYALILAKGGPKFAATKESDGHSGTSSGNGRLTATDVTMARFAETLTQILSRELGRIVVDKTGLDGKYDLKLNWSPDNEAEAYGSATSNASAPGPSIFTALQEQLGLKLESTKGPVKMLVIDHIEQPSEN